MIIARWEGVEWMGKKGERLYKHILVVTEQSQRCKVQHGECGQ